MALALAIAEPRYFGDLGPELAAKGWGVFPATAGKATTIRWREFQSRQPRFLEVAVWARDYPHAGVALPFGPINGDTIGFDIDIDDPLAAAAASEILDSTLGPSPVIRVGNWPRTLRLYRAARKRSCDIGQIQVLGRGRYAVLYGLHPDTHEPYRHVGSADLLQIRARELPAIDLAALRRLRSELTGHQHAGVTRGRGRGATGLRLPEALCGVEKGQRNNAILCIASAYRGYGRTEGDAMAAACQAAAQCTPPYSLKKTRSLVAWVYRNLSAGGSGARTMPSVLQIAFKRAVQQPYELGGSALHRVFLAICEDLQRFRGDQPIALPQIALSKLLDCSQPAVCKMIGSAIELGFLERVSRAYRIGKHAMTYRFVGPLRRNWLY